MNGTQAAADHALGTLDLRGYATDRNQVWPRASRGATRLSAWIRHGMLHLPEVAEAAAQAPGTSADRSRFVDELWWQEYARHLYARLGESMSTPLRALPRWDDPRTPATADDVDRIWDREMACVDLARRELESEGYLVNQTRMWLASHWTVRKGAQWNDGEDWFFRHLLDGSRAANRLGWQWAIGAATGKVYGFSRSQVTRRAPGICERCTLRTSCPIEAWPVAEEPEPGEVLPALRRDVDPSSTAGPDRAITHSTPAAVWITAESLGDRDPAMIARPGLPVIFVWDASLLRRLQLAGHRLVFLAQRLAEIATHRDLQIWLGDPVSVLAESPVSTTFAPVPKWRRITAAVPPAELHPWPWLARPKDQTLTSYTAWRKKISGPYRP